MRHGLHPRRTTATVAGLLLLAAPALSACGFNYATDRVNTISAGVNDRDGEIDVLGAVIVAGEDNQGLFVATLANNSETTADQLTDVSNAATPLETPYLIPAECSLSLFKSYVVPAAGETRCPDDPSLLGEQSGADLESLPAGIAVTGTFKAGDFVDTELTFANGQKTSLQVPVVVPCYSYAPDKFDPPLVLPTSTDAPTEAETSATVDESSGEAGGTPGESTEVPEAGTEETDPYACDPIEPARPVIPTDGVHEEEGH